MSILTHTANGDTIANLKHNFLIDAVATVRANNLEPTAIIDAPRTEQGLAKRVDSTGQYIVPPVGLADIPRISTNQVAVNLMVGTSTDTSLVFTADWTQLMIGIRTGFSVRLLTERFADTGQYAFLCTVRADVQVAQPAAFAVDTGVRS